MAENLIVWAGSPIPDAAPPTRAIADLIGFVQAHQPGWRTTAGDDFDLFIESALRMQVAFESHPHDHLWVRDTASSQRV